MSTYQRPTPPWMRKCAGHAFYRRGDVEASLPIPQRKQYEARGWSYVCADRDSSDHEAYTFRRYFKLDRLITYRGNREVLRGRWFR